MIKTLNLNYSTTKLTYKLPSKQHLIEHETIMDIYKFKQNFPVFGVQNSKTPPIKNKKSERFLFLPKGEGRKGEGGLRTKGYLKFSYEKKDGKWWVIENNRFIKEIELDEYIAKDYEKLPLISIITVVFNGEKYIEETIQSVISQTYPNVEYIIVDGGSTDGTLKIIKKYENKIDYWVSENDCCMYEAINKGLSLSRGDIIASLNSDDMYYDCHVLNDVVNYFKKNKSIDGLYGNIIKTFKNKKIKKKTFQVTFDILLCSEHSTFMPQPTLFLKSKVYSKFKYDLNHKFASDFSFNLEILRKYTIKFYDRYITLFRQHENSITSSGKLDAERKEILSKYGLYRIPKIKRLYLFYKYWIKYKILSIIYG